MKLLYITNGLSGSGGLERVLSVKTSYLAEKYGYEVHIVTLNEEGKAPFYVFSPQVKTHTISLKKKFVFNYLCSYIRQMRRIVRQINPDVISVCDDGLKGFYLPLILSWCCPMVYERHVSKNISADASKVNLLFSLMDFGAKSFDRFVVLTEENKKEWNGYTNLQVIPNPLSFFPDQISKLEKKKVLAVGKFGYQKGYDLLIQAWTIIAPEYPDWSLDIYGAKTELYPIIKEQVKQYQLQNVSLNGPVKNIQEKYMEASIYVMSSRYEGFGMVLTEAMACGVPCVSFDCPYGPGDIIKEGEDGFLVEKENINQLAESMMKLMKDTLMRRRMGQKARENVKRYSLERIATQWDELFSELVDNN